MGNKLFKTFIPEMAKKKVIFTLFVLAGISIVLSFGLVFNTREGNSQNADLLVSNKKIVRDYSFPFLGKIKKSRESFRKLILPIYVLPPASFLDWSLQTLSAINIIPNAYAQGLGFGVFYPFLNIWKVSLTFAFLFLGIVNMIVGIMIIINYGSGQKVLLSIENALPRIIATIILIYFSYAIAGLLIDFMFVITVVVLTFLNSIASAIGLGNYFNMFYDISLGDLADKVIGNIFKAAGDELVRKVFNFMWNNAQIASLILLFQTYSQIVSTLFSFLQGALNQQILGVGLTVIVLIGGLILLGIFLALAGFILGSFATLYFFVKFLIFLIKPYVNILLNIIFAPLILLLNVLPGSSSFSSWLKNLIADLLIYPFFVFFIGLAWIVFNLPKVEVVGFPFLSSSATGKFILRLAAASIVFMTPSLVEGLTSKIRTMKLFEPTGNMGAIISETKAAGAQLGEVGQMIAPFAGAGAWWREKRGSKGGGPGTPPPATP